MTYSLGLSEILLSLRDIAEVIQNTKMPDYGYLFISNTILLFLFEFKDVYKTKKLERQVKSLKEALNEQKKNGETDQASR